MDAETVHDDTNSQERGKKYRKHDHKIYELWWKFLSLSDRYKEFCEIMRTVKDKEDPDGELVKGYNKRNPQFNKDVDYYNHLLNWEFMGDVHVNLFNEWWTDWQSRRNEKYAILNLRDPDLRKKLYKYQFSLYKHRRTAKEAPTPDKVISFLTNSPEYIFVAIPLGFELTTEEIRKEISAMRKDATEGNHDFLLDQCKYRAPYGYIRYDELKKYYDIYNSVNILHKNRKETKINTGVLDSSMFSKYLKNAKAIIRNVEQGIFPGAGYSSK